MGLSGLSGLSGASGLFGGVEIPLTIDGLQLWLKADAGTFQDSAKTTPSASDGDVIGAWADQSGQGNDATQVTTANKPLLKLAIQNGRPVIRSDGVNDFLSTPPVTINSDGLVCFLVIQAVSQALANIAIEMSVNASANDGFWFAAGTAGANGAGGRLKGSVATVNVTVNDPLGGTSVFRIIELVGRGALESSNLYRDGVSISSSATDFGIIGTDNIYIGSRSGGTVAFNGDIAEILIYDSALSDADRGLIEDYLNARYAIF